MCMQDCVFCDIVAGKLPSHTIWEDEDHIAFLSIYPNTDGFTVVATKKHYSSYAFSLPDEVLSGLVVATKKVANLLDKAFPDVSRTGMFFEGFGVDHIHSKLFPMHGTGDLKNWQAIESEKMNEFFNKYPGYLCSNNGPAADQEHLKQIAAQIRAAAKE